MTNRRRLTQRVTAGSPSEAPGGPPSQRSAFSKSCWPAMDTVYGFTPNQ
jgi:hypothetical protein